jgi:hypothetical protein
LAALAPLTGAVGRESTEVLSRCLLFATLQASGRGEAALVLLSVLLLRLVLLRAAVGAVGELLLGNIPRLIGVAPVAAARMPPFLLLLLLAAAAAAGLLLLRQLRCADRSLAVRRQHPLHPLGVFVSWHALWCLCVGSRWRDRHPSRVDMHSCRPACVPARASSSIWLQVGTQAPMLHSSAGSPSMLACMLYA